MRCFRPVFADLVWEYSRSPFITVIICLRWLQFIYVFFLLGVVYSAFDPTFTCVSYLASQSGQPDLDSNTETATTAFYFLFIFSSCFAASRAHSRIWVGPALLFSFIYLGLSAGTQLPSCSTLISQNVGDPSGIVAVILHVLDISYTLLMIIALLWLCAEDPLALISGVDKDGFDFRVRAFLTQNYVKSEEMTWMTRVRFGFFVAPIRHIVASILAVAFCLTGTIIAGIVARIFREKQIDFFNSLVDVFNDVLVAYNNVIVDIDKFPPAVQDLCVAAGAFLNIAQDGIENWGYPFIIALCDALWAISVGAAIACIIVAASLSAAFAAIYDDHVAISKAAFASSSAGTGVGGETTTALIEKEPVDESEASALPLKSWARYCCGTRTQAFLADGNTINIGGGAFSYLHAASYTSLYLLNIFTVWGLTTVVFTIVIFYFTSNATMRSGVSTLVGFVMSLLWNRFSLFLYTRNVADRNKARDGYFLVLLDFVLSATTGVATGVTAGVVRFVLGILHLLFKMTLLNKPILPYRFATYDSGFVAHAGMMKAAWAWALDPESSPRQAQGHAAPESSPTETLHSPF